MFWDGLKISSLDNLVLAVPVAPNMHKTLAYGYQNDASYHRKGVGICWDYWVIQPISSPNSSEIWHFRWVEATFKSSCLYKCGQIPIFYSNERPWTEESIEVLILKIHCCDKSIKPKDRTTRLVNFTRCLIVTFHFSIQRLKAPLNIR